MTCLILAPLISSSLLVVTYLQDPPRVVLVIRDTIIGHPPDDRWVQSGVIAACLNLWVDKGLDGGLALILLLKLVAASPAQPEPEDTSRGGEHNDTNHDTSCDTCLVWSLVFFLLLRLRVVRICLGGPGDVDDFTCSVLMILCLRNWQHCIYPPDQWWSPQLFGLA